MQTVTNHPIKLRGPAVNLAAPLHCALTGVASDAQRRVVPRPTVSKTFVVRSVAAQETFSPLVQEFLDECGYSDK